MKFQKPVTIEIFFEGWQLSDDTGDCCACCGDPCWLKQYEPVFLINGKRTVGREVVVCESCRGFDEE